MKTILVLLAVVIGFLVSGCYHPAWHRPDTTYEQLKDDSNACRNKLIIGSSRGEQILTYERCMNEKGYIRRQKFIAYDDPNAEYYHRKDCPEFHRRMAGLPSSKIIYLSKEQAEKRGLKPCPTCKPF
jgi:hypothetical protein